MPNTFNVLVCLLALLIGILIGERYRKWKKAREEDNKENKKESNIKESNIKEINTEEKKDTGAGPSDK